ncbi:MAG: cytochrome c [Acidobacteria bacterium]|nr:cytochrome c [Acidobacteriota bacterium]
MRRSVLMAIITASSVLGVVICLILLTSSSTVQAAGDVDAGKAVYAKKCKTCHGASGEGNAAIAKSLQVTLKHLASKEVQQKKDDDLKKEINEGTGKMKPVKDLSPADAANLLAYIRTLKEK